MAPRPTCAIRVVDYRLCVTQCYSSKAPTVGGNPGGGGSSSPTPSSTAAARSVYALRTISKGSAVRNRLAQHLCEERRILQSVEHPFVQSLVNTAQEFDGSDAGARPDEAISWGKIAVGAKSVKVYAEATLVMPIIIGETFVRNFDLAKRT